MEGVCDIDEQVIKLINNCYSDVQLNKITELTERTSNWGTINYGALAIGLNEHLLNLSRAEIRAFYDWPSWKPNEVDTLIANVASTLSLKFGYKDVETSLEHLTKVVSEVMTNECVYI